MLSLLVFAAVPQPSATDVMAGKVDKILQQAIADHQLPALAAAFLVDGKPVLVRTYGKKTLGQSAGPDADTVFGIGSTSKAMTAFGLMILVDQGKLELSRPVGQILPQLPKDWQPIPLLNFVTHTSGLPDGGLAGTKGSTPWEVFGNWAKGHPLQFKPGANQLYSNVNFAVAGAVIEKVSGQKYADFMRKAVWGPLGMTRTGPWTTFLKGNMASPYNMRQGKVVAARQGVGVTPTGIPSGGLVSTLDDMMAWEAAIRERRLMGGATYDAMFTPVVPPASKATWHFSPGWQIRDAGGTRVIAKNGSVSGYMSMIQLVPTKGASLILLWNLQSQGADLWRESAIIWHQALGLPMR
ncbi:MAG TPA: serine hydrolase domain-containing protein [Fimbriimonadaceae bacterium]|nr:serine hydrolase domain-containing protein [Fimbriimonadaceae bacterium]